MKSVAQEITPNSVADSRRPIIDANGCRHGTACIRRASYVLFELLSNLALLCSQ